VTGRLALTVLALGLLGGCGEASGDVSGAAEEPSSSAASSSPPAAPIVVYYVLPWHDRVDVSGLTPGTYTFLASNDDPNGLDDGIGPDTDTRTIVVR
jgi:hypothetical protein